MQNAVQAFDGPCLARTAIRSNSISSRWAASSSIDWPSRLFEDALDDLLLKLRGELWIAQPWPPGGHAWHQGVHEVLDTALAAAEMPQQVGTHDPPAQPGTPRHRIVGVGDVEHALTDQVDAPLDTAPTGCGWRRGRAAPSSEGWASCRSRRRTPSRHGPFPATSSSRRQLPRGE